MDRLWIVLCAGVVFTAFVQGRVYSPHELARELHSFHISDWDIPSFVCLAHNASALNTSHVTHMPFSSMRRNISFYGIFGIPDVWLSDCHLTARQVTDEDIENDAKCVTTTLTDRLHLFDRTDYLGALTPHVVDLNKCFDWWEHLPPYVFSANETVLSGNAENEKKSLVTPTTTSEHRPTTICHCDSSGSTLVNVSLILLNIMLAVLCYILYLSFVVRRVVSSDSVQFI